MLFLKLCWNILLYSVFQYFNTWCIFNIEVNFIYFQYLSLVWLFYYFWISFVLAFPTDLVVIFENKIIFVTLLVQICWSLFCIEVFRNYFYERLWVISAKTNYSETILITLYACGFSDHEHSVILNLKCTQMPVGVFAILVFSLSQN